LLLRGDRVESRQIFEREDIVKHVRLAVLLTSGLLISAVAVQAQEKKMEAPKPGPEVKKLGYFVGTWKSEGEIKQNPFMPAGKFSSNDNCEWFPGGFHVVCHSTGKSPSGPVHGLGIMAYNAEEKAYTYTGIDNSGFSEAAKGHVDGNNWTYTSEDKMGGKTYHGRYSMVTSPDAYTFKYETSEDGNNWMVIMEGKTTKAAKKAAPVEKK
jgi:Protein of unknown function (DUF1579)